MAYSLPPLILGKAYEWADIVINILGQSFAGVRTLEFDDPQDMANIMGAGNRAVARSYGNYQPTAKIGILMNEVELIQAIAPGGILQRIPEFDITVTWLDPSLVTRTHTIRNCRFKNNGRKVQQGDTEIIVELDLIISNVDFI